MKFCTGNVRQAWEGFNALKSRAGKKQECSVANGPFIANQLNLFYSRFDSDAYRTECDKICGHILMTHPIVLQEGEVARLLQFLHGLNQIRPQARVNSMCLKTVSPN